MAEYEEDKLADNDFDDEKRLFRAEVRSGRKIKQRSVKEAKRRAVLHRSPTEARRGQAPPHGPGRVRRVATVPLLSALQLVCSG